MDIRDLSTPDTLPESHISHNRRSFYRPPSQLPKPQSSSGTCLQPDRPQQQADARPPTLQSQAQSENGAKHRSSQQSGPRDPLASNSGLPKGPKSHTVDHPQASSPAPPASYPLPHPHHTLRQTEQTRLEAYNTRNHGKFHERNRGSKKAAFKGMLVTVFKCAGKANDVSGLVTN